MQSLKRLTETVLHDHDCANKMSLFLNDVAGLALMIEKEFL